MVGRAPEHGRDERAAERVAAVSEPDALRDSAIVRFGNGSHALGGSFVAPVLGRPPDHPATMLNHHH